MSSSFTMPFTAGPEHIDMNGHVNNMVWLQWVQDIATAHWTTVAPQDQQDAYAWWVSRHEIDYRGNIAEGEIVSARTFIPDPPQGARFLRCVDFNNAEGKPIVQVRSMWVLIDRTRGRPLRITREIAAPFQD